MAVHPVACANITASPLTARPMRKTLLFPLATALMLAVPQTYAAWYTLRSGPTDWGCHLMVSRYDPTSYMEGFLRQEATPPPIEREEIELPDGSKRLTMRTVNKVGPIVVQFFENLDACNEEVRTREIAAGLRPTPMRVEKGETYAQALRKRYGSRLRFANGRVRSAVEAFKIDCRVGDGRYLPLTNVLMAKLRDLDSRKAWLTIEVDTSENLVRVWEQLVGPSGPLNKRHLTMAIEPDGSLRTYGFRAEAMLNACFGSYGDLAELPKPALR